MARTKKSNFTGTGYQKLNERLTILENSIQEAIRILDDPNNPYPIRVSEAKQSLIAAWIREVNL